MSPHDMVIAYLVAGMVYVGIVCRSAWDEVQRENGPNVLRRYFLVACVLVMLVWPWAIVESIREKLR